MFRFIVFIVFFNSGLTYAQKAMAVDSVLQNGYTYVLHDFMYSDRFGESPELEKGLLPISQFLLLNSNVMVRVSVHTDYRDSESNNLRYTEQWGKIAMDILIDQGVDSIRIILEPKGENEPYVISNKISLKYPMFNKGSELSESFIKTLKPELQEIANGLNTRMEVELINP